jgi:ABC-type glutathione transport system ATPase component
MKGATSIKADVTDAVVRLQDVGKVYAEGDVKVAALRGVTFDIPRGRFATIVGPSGSGKTTLLNLVGCIDTPTTGRLEVRGQDIGVLSDNALTNFRSRNIDGGTPMTAASHIRARHVSRLPRVLPVAQFCHSTRINSEGD